MKPEITYAHHKIRKRKGSYRYIYAPNETLKEYQNSLLKKLYEISPHKAAHGFVPNRSIVTNAIPHVGKKYILSLDIKNFFPNTKQDKVEKILTRFYPKLVKDLPWLVYKNHLPQGAPTSPYLANFALYDFDKIAEEKITLMGGDYTRYADDLTFSWNDKIDISNFLTFINKNLFNENYWLSKRKTKLMPYYKRQKVTGIIVNKTLNIPSEIRNQLRAYNHLNRNGKWSESDKEYLAGLNGYNHMAKGTL